MIHVFKDNQLIYSGNTANFYIPENAYVYTVPYKSWSRRYERNYLRPVQDKHVPKELKMLCILLNIPT
mgnify:CR=1 FL=1